MLKEQTSRGIAFFAFSGRSCTYLDVNADIEF